VVAQHGQLQLPLLQLPLPLLQQQLPCLPIYL